MQKKYINKKKKKEKTKTKNSNKHKNDKGNSEISRGRLSFFEFCDFTKNYANRKLGVNSEKSEVSVKRDLDWM